MDLLAGVRKEGSRGGRGDFSWANVKEDQHRENYLGHSLMAPVGRWSKNRDLGWYAKGDDTTAPDSASAAAAARAAEIRAIKEAENDALAAALGLPSAPAAARGAATGANAADVKLAMREAGMGGEEQARRGVGFGLFGGPRGMPEEGLGKEEEKKRSREVDEMRRERRRRLRRERERSPCPVREGGGRDRARASRRRSRSGERGGERRRGEEANRGDERRRSRRSPERPREHGARRSYEREGDRRR
ncbi:MAG: hypothetical protein M1829_003795 [Trizodia sp. TS-e1964]|nr:MAG: hypothetical protein M1829_003795 [Trizodia sp. TS-e1964]